MMKSLLFLWVGWLSNDIAAYTPSKSQTPFPTPSLHRIDRRQLLKSTVPVSLGFAGLLFQQQPAIAAGSPPSADELNRIKVGYQQVQNLLANFEQETTVCRENGGECKRDAEPIRKGKSNARSSHLSRSLPT